MSTLSPLPPPTPPEAETAAPKKKRGRPKGSGTGNAASKKVFRRSADAEGSAQAKKIAAAVLEVLAGLRGTRDAAGALGISEMRYYAVEARAIQGLVSNCEPRKPGWQPTAAYELSKVKKENARLEREIGRLQGIVRAAQRTVGLAPVQPTSTLVSGQKRRRRRPVVRALAIAEALRSLPVPPSEPGTPPTQEW